MEIFLLVDLIAILEKVMNGTVFVLIFVEFWNVHNSDSSDDAT